MRELQEIQKDIEEMGVKIRFYQAQKMEFIKEKAERIFVDFCKSHGVERGDIVRTKHYGDILIMGIEATYPDWIVCRRIKKNGEPYIQTTNHLISSFDGCEVIGHREDWV